MAVPQRTLLLGYLGPRASGSEDGCGWSARFRTRHRSGSWVKVGETPATAAVTFNRLGESAEQEGRVAGKVGNAVRGVDDPERGHEPEEQPDPVVLSFTDSTAGVTAGPIVAGICQPAWVNSRTPDT